MLFSSREIEQSMKYQSSDVKAIDISTALLLLKSRHRLSNKCMSDILSLLHVLRVPNVPKSWWLCKKLIRENCHAHQVPQKRSVCPRCKKASKNIESCEFCKLDYSMILPPLSTVSTFYYFDIKSQLECILLNSSDIIFRSPSSLPIDGTISDIVDGAYYRERLSQEKELFLTLIMNIDGIQPNKGSDNSIWPILLVISEIRPKKRYALENRILAGVWPGPKKPSRDDMVIFLRSKIEIHIKFFKIATLFSP